jgi:hypothetical protein
MLRLLFQDEAEWYFVCETCLEEFHDMQWAGSTKGLPGWRQAAIIELEHARIRRDPCQFCGKGGNGGWMINGRWPAAERRDARQE